VYLQTEGATLSKPVVSSFGCGVDGIEPSERGAHLVEQGLGAMVEAADDTSSAVV
jgi:hypothetical protein